MFMILHKKSETVCEKNHPFAGKSSFGAVHPWNYPKLYNPSTKAETGPKQMADGCARLKGAKVRVGFVQICPDIHIYI